MFRITKPDYGVPLSIRLVPPAGLHRRCQTFEAALIAASATWCRRKGSAGNSALGN
ncbi:MAG: hypothetical protein JWQ92_3187 [Amnibacterium sp.]|nr:hypothetical protein [Amnibacterium sp.]